MGEDRGEGIINDIEKWGLYDILEGFYWGVFGLFLIFWNKYFCMYLFFICVFIFVEYLKVELMCNIYFWFWMLKCLFLKEKIV